MVLRVISSPFRSHHLLPSRIPLSFFSLYSVLYISIPIRSDLSALISAPDNISLFPLPIFIFSLHSRHSRLFSACLFLHSSLAYSWLLAPVFRFIRLLANTCGGLHLQVFIFCLPIYTFLSSPYTVPFGSLICHFLLLISL